MRPSRLAVPLVLSLLAARALAGPAVTIYSRDLALVRESRPVDLAGGRDTLRLEGLPERLDPSSIRLVLPGGARLLRLAYRFDVASGDGLLEHARGQRVRVTTRGDRVTEGLLVAADGAWLVVRADDGALATLSRAVVETVRLASPGALASRPAIEAVVEGGRRGRSDLELSYLTAGLSWSAEHVLVRRGEDQGTWSASAWVENQSGRDFVDADLRLVAGEPRREPSGPVPMPRMATMMALGGSAPSDQRTLEEQGFSEYHLYTLPAPATLRDRETQGLVMLEPRTVRLTPRYRVRPADGQGVRLELELKDTREAGLGVPLPAGRVRAYQADASGALELIGETRIAHTAAGETLTVDVGRAFDLVAERRVVSERRVSDREREQVVEITLRNRKRSDVVIAIEEALPGDFDVLSSSHPWTRKDAHTLRFEVPVSAGGEVVVRYGVRVRL